MFPASTYKGGAVLAFPDVCKTPGPPAPAVPAPFPNVGSNQSGKASKSVVGSKKQVVSKDASQQDLLGTLDELQAARLAPSSRCRPRTPTPGMRRSTTM